MNDMRKLINLMEGVMAVPALGEQFRDYGIKPNEDDYEYDDNSTLNTGSRAAARPSDGSLDHMTREPKKPVVTNNIGDVLSVGQTIMWNNKGPYTIEGIGVPGNYTLLIIKDKNGKEIEVSPALAQPVADDVLSEKSKSEKQARFMAAAAHDPKFAKKAGIDGSVAKEFNKADTGTKQLSNAMKHVKESEAEMQTASTAAVDDADSNFDAAQAGATEVDEAHVDTCRQSNPNPADEACAMEESSEYDHDFIRQAIIQFYDVATSEEELKKMVAGETGYGHNPDFDNMFHSALDHFLNGDDSMIDDYDDSMDGDFDSAMASAGHGSDEDYGGDDFPMEEDLNNGYRDIEVANGQDFFPNGADSPVVSATGPSGARQGDNPEQKKMQVAETHKELVYAYRNFLKESVTQKKS